MSGRAQRIEETLTQEVDMLHLDVLDESGNHSVPDGAESHFKVVVVAEVFTSMRRIQRHRLLNDLLAPEFAGGMHALAVHAYTPDEWQSRYGSAPMSPPCASQKSASKKSASQKSESK